MTNSLYSDLIKIGMTAEHPEVRANSLSKQTASAGTFKVEWGLRISDYKFAENLIKSTLKKHHNTKEFYKISVSEAIKLVEDSLDKYFKIEGKNKYLLINSIALTHGEWSSALEIAKLKRKKLLQKALEL